MARATHIYLIHPKGQNDPVIAVFTVKHESQTWAENCVYGIAALERTRMRDGGNSRLISDRVLCPWE